MELKRKQIGGDLEQSDVNGSALEKVHELLLNSQNSLQVLPFLKLSCSTLPLRPQTTASTFHLLLPLSHLLFFGVC